MLEKFYNPLLYYVDKEGHSVFRNYCLFKNDGCLYDETFSIQTAGKALEYRMENDKKLRLFAIISGIILYIMFIHNPVTLWSVLKYEFIWLFLFIFGRIICAKLYSTYLLSIFGDYKLVDFRPNISKEKFSGFKRNFYSKCLIFCLVLLMLFLPAFLMIKIIKLSVKSQKPHFKTAIVLTKIYSVFYPKFTGLYDMDAYAKYMKEDFNGALEDYKKVLSIKGKSFSDKDLTRYANILYLEKKLHGSQEAVDVFNDFYTRKNHSILDKSKLLWMKSMFSIQNKVADVVTQDYDDLLQSLNKKDSKNNFYISSDKAYMLYLMKDYKSALALYDILINFAINHSEKYEAELQRLYVERGYTKRRLGDNIGADEDFLNSNIDLYELEDYEPKITKHMFIVEKF